MDKPDLASDNSDWKEIAGRDSFSLHSPPSKLVCACGKALAHSLPFIQVIRLGDILGVAEATEIAPAHCK